MDAVIKLASDLKLLKAGDNLLLNSLNVQIPFAEDSLNLMKTAVAEKTDDYVVLFIKMLNNIHMENAVGTLLTLLQALCESTTFCISFARIGQKRENVDPFEPFVSMLHNKNIGIVEKNYSVLASLLSVTAFETQTKTITQLVEACLSHINQNENSKMMEIGVHTLSILLRNPEIRTLYTAKNGIPLLTGLILENSGNVQLMYEIGFCIWMLSFSDASIIVLLKHNIIALLHDILRTSKKEKCTRIALLALKNLVRLQQRQHGYRTAADEFLPDAPTVDADEHRLNIFGDMISVGLVRTLQLLSKRSFGDPDILAEVGSLLELLEKKIEDTTSFADYKQEVLSGRLDWTPVHKSEKFWKENIKEFEKEDYKILRTLCHLLDTTQDNKTVTIICYDLGEFVKYHPNGRKILNALDVKTKIIALMSSENQEVSKQALLCTQKMMVQKWEFLSS